jgi:hypothetical protein
MFIGTIGGTFSGIGEKGSKRIKGNYEGVSGIRFQLGGNEV